MDYEELKKKYIKALNSIESLEQKVAILESEEGIISEEDILKLKILERVPMTMWACDRDLKIVLWTPQCEKNYQIKREDAIGKRFIDLFVSEPEKRDAELDCIRIIDTDQVFHNFIASDKAEDGTKRYMLTNCFRIRKNEDSDWLQAEVALEISDIHQAIENHRTLREAGIEIVAKNKKYIEIEKKDLENILNSKFQHQKLKLNEQIEKLDTFILKLQRESDSDTAKEIKQNRKKEFEEKIIDLENKKNELLIGISEINTIEKCDQMRMLVDKY